MTILQLIYIYIFVRDIKCKKGHKYIYIYIYFNRKMYGIFWIWIVFSKKNQ